MLLNGKYLVLTASLFAVMGGLAFAGEESNPKAVIKSNRFEWPQKWFEMSDAQKQSTLASIRKTNQDLAIRIEKETKEIQKRNDEWNALTPEQKEAKKREWRAKMEETVNCLRTKKKEGKLTDEESRKLVRMEEWLKRLDQPREKPKDSKGNPDKK